MKALYPRVASLRSPAGLRERLSALGAALPCEDAVETGPGAPLARPLILGPGPRGPLVASNRFVVQPMEGWDATREGLPSPLTERRWRRFGRSGAGWIWGGEAVAVRPEGRANPNQLAISERCAPELGRLRAALLEEARAAGHPAPVVGLQLTHSGRWSRPEGAPRPRVAYRHPLLDARVGVVDDGPVLADAEVPALVEAFARAARLALDQGFDFVDLKHCHGYLLHEFLSARSRPGPYGGEDLAGRTRLLRELVAALRDAAPGLRLGVRLSVFDGIPHRSVHGGPGEPEPHPTPYPHAFGVRPDAPGEIDLAEPVALAQALVGLRVDWINVSAASPYYAPHLQRPALFPPSDGYPPPEDPLLSVARLLGAARDLKAAVPEAVVVASGWSYLQDFLAHVAQATLRAGWFDAVGLGRMVLSYPELPADVLAGRIPDRRRICRSLSDCTTAPRHGLPSGCYPLDDFYRARPEREALEELKRRARGGEA